MNSIAHYKWVLCSTFYDNVVVALPEIEKIKPWKMTEMYSFPTVQEFKEIINSFKGDGKKSKSDVRKWSTVVVTRKRIKQNNCRNRHRQYYLK